MEFAHPADGRDPVVDEHVLEAMRAVPRRAFVPPEVRDQAYQDSPLPIGHGQTISQPYIVALMTEQPPAPGRRQGARGRQRVGLPVRRAGPPDRARVHGRDCRGAGSRAAQTLKDQGYGHVGVCHGDGHLGWPEPAPFDAIIVTCAPEALPEALWNQLKPGGRIVIPIGPVDRVQRLVVVSKTPDGRRHTQTITDVRFVPIMRTLTISRD